MTDEPTLIDRLRKEASELDDELGETVALLREAADALEQWSEAALEDWEQAFEMYWTANRRCTELYNAAHPGSEGTLPDQGKMIDWLADQIGRREVALKRIQTWATDEATAWVADAPAHRILNGIAKLAEEALKQTGQS